MNGLDKLKEKIMHDAESAAETKLNEAKKQAEKIPADFEEQIKACTKGKISLSKDFAPIKNGFILKNGMTEENCSFDGIMEAREEELQDKTAKLLFSKV